MVQVVQVAQGHGNSSAMTAMTKGSNGNADQSKGSPRMMRKGSLGSPRSAGSFGGAHSPRRGSTGSAHGSEAALAATVHSLTAENRELKRANEILRQAAAYFAQAELECRRR